MKVPPAVLALSIGAASLALTACGGPGRPSPEASGTKLRPVEPRLTGSFGYALCRPDPRPGDLVPEPLCPGAEEPAPASGKPGAATRGGSRTDPHAEALAPLLVQRNESSADRAVERLERLTREKPGDAGLLSDLAAAYIVRAQRRDAPYDLVLALASAGRAVKAAPALHEARFNRALALELLFLDVEAQAAWGEYMRLDRTSPWAAEALARRAAIAAANRADSWSPPRTVDEKTVRELLRSHPQALREAAEYRLLGEWADACARGDRAAADRLLRILRLAGDALKVRGEHLVQDTVATIDKTSPRGRRRKLLVEGHRAFQEGFRLYKQGDIGRAVAHLETARERLESAGSPFAARAAFYLAACAYRTDRYTAAYEALHRLRAQVPAESHPTLRAHIDWVEALSLAATGRLLEAVRSYREALSLFEATGERSNEAEVRALLTETLEQIGLSREAWSQGYRALRETRAPASPMRALRIVANTTLEEGQPEVALYFQDELIRRTALWNDPVSLADALFRRAQMRGRAGRRAEALDDLRKAKEAAASQPDAELRHQTLAHITKIEGELDLEVEPRRALELLTSALDYYQRKNNHILTLEARRARARAWRRLGDLAGAEADLVAGFRALESLQEDLSEEETRLAFLDRTAELVDEMIAFQVVEKRRPDLAFAYADRAHTQVLPARAAAGAQPSPLSLREIRRRLPADTTLVQFSLAEDRLFLWVVRRGGLQLVETAADRRQIEDLVRSIRTEESLSSLFDLLVRPWVGGVSAEESLVFVPDKALHAVPFAALLDRRNGRYLVEDHQVMVAPSATLYINAVDRDRRLASSAGQERALIVGDPAFDRQLFRTLPSLAAAEAEARQVATLYPEKDLLLGGQAGVERFLSLAPSARWIHFAGHALANDREPLLSMLVFAAAGDKGAASVLYARDIYQLGLENTDLVVLSACSTAAIPRGGSEGVTNLARAFLAAGAPNVVASLWEVNDRFTSKLFSVFHRKLLAHGDPARALREAQLALLHDKDASAGAPAAWGAFEVFGGSIQPTSRRDTR